MAVTRHKYEYPVDLAVDTAATHVVNLVGSSKRVLEIGCGPGSITKVLARERQCRVTGLELDPGAIAKAAPYCETIMQVDLNSVNWPDLLNGTAPFDVVVAADVLEHLYDPWTTLKQMVSLVGPSGYLVISLPHVGHAAVISCLINGDFEYGDWGLLDRTHIRFFGLRNIEALLAQADLKAVDVKYVIKPPEETEFSASWAKLSSSVRSVLVSGDHADVYQVVVKAVPHGYLGAALSLGPPRSQPVGRRWMARWKRRIAGCLSPQVKQWIRKGFGLIGVRL